MEPNPNKIAGYQNLVNIFDGEIFCNINYFLNNIQEIGEIATWNDAELLAVFKSKLKGPALQFFIDDPELTNEKKFDTVKTKFKKYFENKTTLSHRQQQFSNCKQNPGESVRSYSTRVSNLTINYFGIQNASKTDASPIVDQTKLAKFLEGLHPPLKRLALTRNPTSFEEAVENALLDEINSQFTNIESIHNVSVDREKGMSEQLLDSKLSEVLNKQMEISNQMIGALTSQINRLSTQIVPNMENTKNFRHRNYSQRQPCVHCGKKNHFSSQCFSLRIHNRYPRQRDGYRMQRSNQHNAANQQNFNARNSFSNSPDTRGNSRQSNGFASYAIRGRNQQNVSQQTGNSSRPLNR